MVELTIKEYLEFLNATDREAALLTVLPRKYPDFAFED